MCACAQCKRGGNGRGGEGRGGKGRGGEERKELANCENSIAARSYVHIHVPEPATPITYKRELRFKPTLQD